MYKVLIAEEKVSVLVVRCTSRHPHPSSLNRDNTWHLAGHCSTAALQWDYSLIVAAALHTADCSRGQLAVQCQYQYNWVLGYICAKLRLSFIHEASKATYWPQCLGLAASRYYISWDQHDAARWCVECGQCGLVLQKVASELHPKVRNHGEGP